MTREEKRKLEQKRSVRTELTMFSIFMSIVLSLIIFSEYATEIVLSLAGVIIILILFVITKAIIK